MTRNAVKCYNICMGKSCSFLGSLVASQIPKMDFKIPQITYQLHKMAINAVKYFKYCMDKFIWPRVLFMRSNVLNSNILGPLMTSQTSKKEL